MKSMLILLPYFMIFLFQPNLQAENRVVVPGGLCFAEDPCQYTFNLFIENDDTIHEATIGLKLWGEGTPGMAIFDIIKVAVVPDSRFDGALEWSFSYDAAEPTDSILIKGTQTSPGDYDGVPPGPLQNAFSITLDVSNIVWGDPYEDSGIINIDSCTLIAPENSWSWDYISPQFSENHILIAFVLCGLPTFTVVPPDDKLLGSHCDGATFQFVAEPSFVPDHIITGFELCSLPSTATLIQTGSQTGLFTFYPNEPGVYEFTAMVWQSCPTAETYDFEVIMTNAGQEFQNCPTQAISRYYGSNVIYDLGLVNHDCDALNETITMLSGPIAQPTNPPVVNNGIITWQTTPDDVGVWLFEVANEDPYSETATCQMEINITAQSANCGDANSDGTVDVSDAVHLINYIFVGGFAPEPLERGNVNCDLVVDVSDAVWIINYVFVGGPAPCEC